MRTYKDNYPCGRKFCSGCKKWRQVHEFQVRQWADEPHCTVPLTLTSLCRFCGMMVNRIKHGHAPRKHYEHGAPGSKQWREHRNKMNRESARERRKDKEYREQQREYRVIWRNAKLGAKSRSTRKRPYPRERMGIQLDGKLLHGYLKRFLVVELISVGVPGEKGATTKEKVYLNGKPLTSSDSSYLNKLKKGTLSTCPLEKADYFASHYELPLWEMEEVATIRSEAA